MTARVRTTIEVDAALLARLRETSLPDSASLTDAESCWSALLAGNSASTRFVSAGDEHADGLAYTELHAMRHAHRGP